jgi:hypothetical protein
VIVRNHHVTTVQWTFGMRVRGELPEIDGPTSCCDCGCALTAGIGESTGGRTPGGGDWEGETYLSHDRNGDALCTACADAEDAMEAEEQAEARKALLHWQRTGGSVQLEDGLVTIEGPGVARASFDCSGGRLPVGALYVALGGFGA